jgi:outer membrane protein OmpA-like peptidoglycan-associated protein
MNSIMKAMLWMAVVSCAVAAAAQDTTPNSQPLININVSRTIDAVNYWSRGSTRVDFVGTALMPRATGQAKVESKGGALAINAELKGLESPSTFGPIYLVYVLWAITPEGRPNNLGQLTVKGGKSQLQVTTKLQTFGMFVTAEPYFAVTVPSDDVVLENKIRSDTQGATTPVDAKLLQRGRYDTANLAPMRDDGSVPLDLLQARNAVRIAKSQQADKYAHESLAKAEQALAQSEDYQKRKQKNSVPTTARNAVQAAEDARSISVRKQREEQIADQQKASEDARAAEASKRSEAEAAEKQQTQARSEADAARAKAEAAAAKDALARAQAEATAAKEAQARGKADEQAKRDREAASQAEREKQELRARLLDQFNRVLPTTDTPRGLIVNMGDVLFDTGKADLRAPAREALAKLSGIVLNYPKLQLAVEGHTDSIGSDEFNQLLSEKRANAVRDYLVSQHLAADSITARGMGKLMPVADNSTSAGRQKNRRVEIIVSGEVIGSQIGANTQ